MDLDFCKDDVIYLQVQVYLDVELAKDISQNNVQALRDGVWENKNESNVMVEYVKLHYFLKTLKCEFL